MQGMPMQGCPCGDAQNFQGGGYGGPATTPTVKGPGTVLIVLGVLVFCRRSILFLCPVV